MEKTTSLSSETKKILKSNDLVYVTEDQLSIERHKKGKGFFYTKNGQKITNQKKLEGFKKLVIPPAWKEVRICDLKNGHLQAVGRDTKDRKVYRYHPLWTQMQNQTKFSRMLEFGKILPKIRKQIRADLELRGMPQQKVLALVIQLMEETHFRIGNQYYASENNSFGLTTLRSKHVEFSSNKMTFEFIGKKGKPQTATLKDKKLVKLVNRCEEIPGWELFKYYDEAKQKQCIDSGMVNQYIREISEADFSAKDFRTWAGSKLFFEALLEIGYVENQAQNKKNRNEAFKETAKALGNTKTVCEKYYVHPKIPENYENGKIQKYMERLKKLRNNLYFSKTEKAMLELISA
ncbi:MAG TPA: DNA topoisomerase IB [Flavobacteriaceae bacterium]|nr:DNA topoisomerase IB [Flavobacteriaceae bacterium]